MTDVNQTPNQEINSTATERKPLLVVKGLCKSFALSKKKKLDVLRSIDCVIHENEKVAVIGPSGGGKSTFLRCLNCLEIPTSGSIVFDGTELTDPKNNINKSREKMGMVFQQFNLFNNKTVLQNIMMTPSRRAAFSPSAR